MIITPLRIDLIPRVHALMDLGSPYVRARTHSDYWLYSQLFASTCPVALDGDLVAGAVVAFRSQERPSDVYVQDVMTDPAYRRHGVARRLLDSVRARALELGCSRMYLTSEPENAAADSAWRRLGFVNVDGDHVVNGVRVITDYKGPGRSRAVYERTVN